MSKLAQLQADFQACIINENSEAFKQCIIDDAKVGVEKRLSIYADAYRLRIIEALATAYPKLHMLLGDDLFDATARQYIDQYPSSYRNMRWVGNQMSQHLTNVLPQHPIAAELASFEWVLGLAFDAEDALVLQLEDLATIPPETWADLSFEFHPSMQLLDLQWNVIPVWQALDAEVMPPGPVQTNEPCLIWRNDLNSHYRSLDVQEYQAIQQVKADTSFGNLCESLYTTLEAAATQQAAQYLAGWLEAGIISKIKD
jgi:hypothetical protein